MKNIFIYPLITTLMATCFFVVGVNLTNAQVIYEGLTSQEVFGDFLVGPGKTELTLKPGESDVVNVTISNRLGKQRVFQLSVEDFVGTNDPQQTVVLLEDQKGPYSLKDYLDYPALEITLDHGERATIPVRVTIPSDAEPGGLYGSLLVSTKTDPADGESLASASIISRIGILFFVEVEGDIKREGNLEEFKTRDDKKVFFTDDPVDFQILYRNTGSVHLNPYGQVTVTNILGAEVGQVNLDPWFAMPNSLRLREFSWDGGKMIGRYQAILSLNKGYQNIVETHKTTFYVFPLKTIGLALGAIIVVLTLIVLLFSKFEFRRKS